MFWYYVVLQNNRTASSISSIIFVSRHLFVQVSAPYFLQNDSSLFQGSQDLTFFGCEFFIYLNCINAISIYLNINQNHFQNFVLQPSFLIFDKLCPLQFPYLSSFEFQKKKYISILPQLKCFQRLFNNKNNFVIAVRLYFTWNDDQSFHGITGLF